MKQILRNLLIFTTIPIIGMSQTGLKSPANKNYVCNIKVHIKGLSGGECLLANHYGDKQFIQDTIKVDPNGWMEITDTAAKPGGIYLLVLPSKKYFELILTDQQKFTAETDTNDLVKNMKITGNKENQYFYEYLNYLADKQKEMEPVNNLIKVTHSKDSIAMLQKKTASIDSIVKDYKRAYYKIKHPETFMAEVLSAMDEPDQIPSSKWPKKADGTIDSTFNYWNFRNHYWDGMNFKDERLIRTPVYAGKLKFYLDKLIPQHPDSIIAACDWIIEKARPAKELFKYSVYYITYTYETSKIMGYDAIFVHIVDTYYKTDQVWWVNAEQKKKIIDRSNQLSYSLLGKTAVNLTMIDTLGKVRTLQSIKAKYTVLIFWDPTCSHCKKEIPLLKTYYDSLRTAGVSFEVFAIVSEADLKGWRAYVKEHKLNWINVTGTDAQELANAKYYYDVYSTPTIYLLDEQKVIFGKRLDVDGLKPFLNRRIESDKKKSN